MEDTMQLHPTMTEPLRMFQTAEKPDGSLIGAGIFADGSGYLTYHDGSHRENTDYFLTPEQVDALRAVFAAEG